MVALTCISPVLADPEPQTLPEMALLEYLAEMEQVEGQWISALDMQNKKGGSEEKTGAGSLNQILHEKKPVSQSVTQPETHPQSKSSEVEQ